MNHVRVVVAENCGGGHSVYNKCPTKQHLPTFVCSLLVDRY